MTVSDDSPASGPSPEPAVSPTAVTAPVAAAITPPLTAAPRVDQRLHPASWMFVLISTLKPWLLPLAVLIVFGRGDRWAMWGAAATILFGTHAVITTLFFRYRLDPGQLFVREGVLSRTERHVPFARIQNVAQRRNVLHRLLGVTELRLESATGGKPEAVMNVIALAEAARIERAVRGRADDAGADADPAAAAEPPGDVLLELPFGEIVRHGIVSNRGMVVVAAVFGVLWQFDVEPQELPLVRSLWTVVVAEAELQSGALQVIAAILTLVAVLILLRALSVALSFVTLAGFRLERRAGHLQTEAGLLTRVRSGAMLDKIQRFVVEERWLHRRLGRQALRVDVAGARQPDGSDDAIRLRWVAPIAPAPSVAALVGDLAAGLDLDELPWERLHERAARREAMPGAVMLGLAAAIVVIASAIADWSAAATMLVLAVLLALHLLNLAHARGWARFARYAVTDRVVAFRSGWIKREWVFLPVEKIQVLTLRASFLDRRRHMATLVLDAAATGSEHAIAIPYLPEKVALAIFEDLRRRRAVRGGEPSGADMHYLLFYDVADDYVERRAPLREAHLAHAQAAVARGELVLGGALADPADGAVLLFTGTSAESAEAFAREDPYVRAGLVRAWRVRPWATVVGKDAALKPEQAPCGSAPAGDCPAPEYER